MDKEFYHQITLPDVLAKHEPELPSQIGPYHIESLLKKGGMSLLYLGREKDSSERVVIKVLPSPLLKNHTLVKQFTHEAELISKASHPHIVKLLDHGKWEGGLYLAMEYIHGLSLRQFLFEHSFTLRKALEIIVQIASALSYLHKHGIIHHDLKPENILITEKGEIKIIDFGISEESKKKQSSKFTGTPNYMSPEAKKDPYHVTFASDIYSLGVIAYELILGHFRPGHLHLNWMPKPLRIIIERMLKEDPKERYAQAEFLIEDLTSYLALNEVEKDDTHLLHIQDMMQQFKKTHDALLPKFLPEWPSMEIAFSKMAPGSFSFYYDFFHLPDHGYAILIAESLKENLSGSLEISWFKGMVRSKIAQFTEPELFLQELNQTVCRETDDVKLSCTLLLLYPQKNTFLFLSCGPYFLLDYSEGQTSFRLLKNENPYLGEELSPLFNISSGNWKGGEILFFSNLKEENSNKDLLLVTEQVFLENVMFSPQKQIEAIQESIPAELKQASHLLFLIQKFE